MTLNSSGKISLGGSTVGQSIELELGLSGTASASFNSSAFRTLAGIASGPISLNSFYGKSNIPSFYSPSNASGSVITRGSQNYNGCGTTNGSIWVSVYFSSYYYSTDRINWTQGTFGSSNFDSSGCFFYTTVYQGGTFYAYGAYTGFPGGGSTYPSYSNVPIYSTSTNGINWTSPAFLYSDGGLTAFIPYVSAYGGGNYLIVGAGEQPGGKVYQQTVQYTIAVTGTTGTSFNGGASSYTPTFFQYYSPVDIAYGSVGGTNYFFTVGNYGTALAYAYTSNNGANWTYNTIGSTQSYPGYFVKVLYVNGNFYMIGNLYTGNGQRGQPVAPFSCYTNGSISSISDPAYFAGASTNYSIVTDMAYGSVGGKNYFVAAGATGSTDPTGNWPTSSNYAGYAVSSDGKTWTKMQQVTGSASGITFWTLLYGSSNFIASGGNLGNTSHIYSQLHYP